MTARALVERAIADDQFRRQLKADPAGAAKAAGVNIPAGASLVVLEDDAHTMHLVLTDDTQGDDDLMPEAAQILQRARRDAAFKAQLQRDPWAAVKDEVGVALPESLNLVVVQDSAQTIHVVLPVAESPEGELSDLELEQVAGGRGRRRRRRSSGGGGGGTPPCSTMTGCLAISTSG